MKCINKQLEPFFVNLVAFNMSCSEVVIMDWEWNSPHPVLPLLGSIIVQSLMMQLT